MSVDGTNVSQYVDSVSHVQNQATATVTAFGDNDEAMIAGLKSGSFGLSGHWDATQDGVLQGVFDGSSVTLFYGPAGSTAGSIKYTATCFVDGYTIDSSVSDRVTWSANFTRSGALTYGTY